MGSATSIRPGQLVLTLRRQTPLLHRRYEGDRADLRRRKALGPNPTAARFWVSTDSEADPFLDGLREGMRAFPPPAKVTKPSALFICQPGRGTWRNTNRVTSNGGAPRRQTDRPSCLLATTVLMPPLWLS